MRASRLRGAATLVVGMILPLLFSGSWINGVASQLMDGYYSQSCPQAETIARQTLSSSLFLDITAPAALVRLAFHDCQVQGCDGSVLLATDSSRNIRSELMAGKSIGIRRLDFIDRIKSAVEAECPNTVSCSDIVVMAARDSVALSGGPLMRVQLGRKDGNSASNDRADAALPASSINVDGLMNVFTSMGLTLEESVALVGGGHSLGVGHCASFANRLYPQVDPSLNPLMAGTLQLLCPPVFSNSIAFSNNDLTNVIFDNQYFRDVQSGRGLLTLDNEISRDPRTVGIVRSFATNQGYFFQKFESGFRKMTQHQVLTGGAGEIRRNCRFVNSGPQRQEQQQSHVADPVMASNVPGSETSSSVDKTNP
ncbi:hypothetical protein R1sor_024080 [Riccia sorocarpa]|uniref:Peroxidase n=1 Tax=Riccia sorocarpa TaxID=122646 RepID=A0ABD3GVG8_9MARC